LQLNKRDCGTSIELIPCGADMLKVVWDLNGDRQTFWASSAVGYQFNSFVRAVYELYREGIDSQVNYNVYPMSRTK